MSWNWEENNREWSITPASQDSVVGRYGRQCLLRYQPESIPKGDGKQWACRDPQRPSGTDHMKVLSTWESDNQDAYEPVGEYPEEANGTE